MNKWLLSLVTVCLTLLTLSLLPQKLMAQGKSFGNVIPFGTTSGRVGFFDQNSGKVYIYDNNLTDCVFTGKMTDLGSPITISSSNSKSEANENTGKVIPM